MFFYQLSDKMKVTKIEKMEIDSVILEKQIIFFNKQVINVPLIKDQLSKYIKTKVLIAKRKMDNDNWKREKMPQKLCF